ncbi:TPA: hypothetical protein ACPKAL_003244 [Vibrio alginolyticus]|uniref:hypothetical protein n=1 Tax=Vibrio alginolyticus TaxID=663 RepID=UPI00063D8D86|nr:hypothetical protein [Vibrio alginolyticus]KLI70174.1 hypothetical protein AAW26_22155 [Vibrio alginolyticus]MDM4740721.1 hypothetical protein [Vibrio alginolyticus]MDM4761073.1 hypothetical protein [Vibrio alginolyticus]
MTEGQKLLGMVLIPLGLSFVFHLIFALITGSGLKHIQLSEEELAKQPLFWLSLELPFLYFLSTGYFAWEGYTLNISASGFNTFIKISTLPVGILGLSIPLAVLVSRLHSTKQTASQLGKSQTQLRFTEDQIAIARENDRRANLKQKEEGYQNAKETFTRQILSLFNHDVSSRMNEADCLTIDAHALFDSIFANSTTRVGIQKPDFTGVQKAIKLMRKSGLSQHEPELRLPFQSGCDIMFIKWNVDKRKLPLRTRLTSLVPLVKKRRHTSNFAYSCIINFCSQTVKQTANNVYEVNRIDD